MTTSVSHASEASSITKLREAFVLAIFARFESATGKPIDVPVVDKNGYIKVDETDNPIMTRRRQAMLEELNVRRAGQRHLEAAREWILRGDPARYGRLTLADFYPSEQQLKSLNLDVSSILDREYRRGWNNGYREGAAKEQQDAKARQARTEEAKAKALKIREAVEFVKDRKLLSERLAALDIREQELLARELKLKRTLERIAYGLDEDRCTPKAIEPRGHLQDYTTLGDALPAQHNPTTEHADG